VKNVILHTCQVCWLGSVPFFIRDFSRAYPEFHHVMMYLHEWKTHYGAMNDLRLDGLEVCQSKILTREIMEYIDPVVLVMHNTPGSNIEGTWPYKWLQEWPAITVHHMKSKPLIPADLDVFVSKEIYNRGFKMCEGRFREKVFCPPCIDTSPYEKIERAPESKRCVVGRLQTDSPRRHPPEVLDIFRAVKQSAPACTFSIVGGAKYYEDTQGLDIEMPAVGSAPPEQFYAGFDILVLRNPAEVTDTWSRIVTEGMAAGLPVVSEDRGGPVEQIDSGENGFLCHTDDEFIECITKLANDPKLRYEMGMRARKKAVREFGLARLRRDTESVVLKASVGVI